MGEINSGLIRDSVTSKYRVGEYIMLKALLVLANRLLDRATSSKNRVLQEFRGCLVVAQLCEAGTRPARKPNYFYLLKIYSLAIRHEQVRGCQATVAQ